MEEEEETKLKESRANVLAIAGQLLLSASAQLAFLNASAFSSPLPLSVSSAWHRGLGFQYI